MKRKGLDISLFLVIVLLTGVAIGLMHGIKKKDTEEKKYSFENLSHVTQDTIFFEDIIQSLQLLFESRNIGMLAHAIQQFNFESMYSLVEMIINKERFLLDDQDKLSLLLMLANLNSKSKKIQFKFFDLMTQSDLFDSNFLLFETINKDFLAILPSFLEWIDRKKYSKKIGLSSYDSSDLKTILINKVFCSAIEHNDLSALEILNISGFFIDSKKASDLLLNVVYDRKKSMLIPFLIHRGANVNQIGPDRYTLLSKAVFYNDLLMARTLLEAGADVDKQVDESIGSARHIAQISGNKELEQLLNGHTIKG